MDLSIFMKQDGEKPLDKICHDGGMTAIFRTICCIGDSLSSGEFELFDKDGNRSWHDMFEYSWGQYIARMTGAKVLNYSVGGMSARKYIDSFAEENDFYNKDNACQAYIISLGVNDLLHYRWNRVGTLEDCEKEYLPEDERTFCYNYGKIIKKYKEVSPNAKFFLVTIPRGETFTGEDWEDWKVVHAEVLNGFAKYFDNTYVIDLHRYLPIFDKKVKNNFFMYKHMNPMGYVFMSKVISSYIDYIIRNNPEDFKQAGLICTPYYLKERLPED